jgi:hypothetical protein
LHAELTNTKSYQEKEISMAFEGWSELAVHECNRPCSEGTNLCDEHLVPGMVIKHGNGTCVITAWYAEHANEAGVILLNDYALADLFGVCSGQVQGVPLGQAQRTSLSDVECRGGPLTTLERIYVFRSCLAKNGGST